MRGTRSTMSWGKVLLEHGLTMESWTNVNYVIYKRMDGISRHCVLGWDTPL